MVPYFAFYVFVHRDAVHVNDGLDVGADVRLQPHETLMCVDKEDLAVLIALYFQRWITHHILAFE